MVKWLKEKITNVTDKLGLSLIEKRFIKATKQIELKNKRFEHNTDEEKSEFIGSRSCYRQYFRLFGKGNNNSATIQYSENCKVLARDIINAKFDITKLANNISAMINECNKMCSTLAKEEPALAKNSIIEVYMRAVNILTNKKLLSFIQKINAQIPQEYFNNVSKSKITLNEKKNIYQNCYLIIAYTNLIFLVLHMTSALAITASCLVTSGGSNFTIDQIQSFFINRFKYLFFKGVLNSIDLIVYFENFDEAKIKAFLNRPLDEAKTYESYHEDLKYRFSTEADPVVTPATVLVIGIGVALGIVFILPLIRGLIYYWGSLRIDLSNFFKDESLFFSYNAIALEKSLADAKTDKERERIQKAIDKQTVLAEKLEKLSYKFSIEYETAAHEANAIAEADERYEIEEERDTETPQIFL